MPVADVYMWSGVSKDAKNKIIRGITKAFEELGIPSQAVEIIIIEVPKENWGVGGESADKNLKM
jgi:4-oxalocrotonate tautomerase